jgi:hypothetical protein
MLGFLFLDVAYSSAVRRNAACRKRTERLGTARWTVKPARVAGERTGVSKSIGRRKMPGGSHHPAFSFLETPTLTEPSRRSE